MGKRWHRRCHAFLLMMAALCACAGPVPTSGGTGQPHATATPTPQSLYAADWSRGTGGWTLPPHWRIQQGQLVNDGLSKDPIAIPYPVTTGRYTVEIQLQVLGYAVAPDCFSCSQYGLGADSPDGHQLYLAGVNGLDPQPPHHGFSLLDSQYRSPDSPSFPTNDFLPGVNVRAYTVIVDGKDATFDISDVPLGTVVTTVALSPAHLFIVDWYIQLAVSSVTITTP